MSRVLLLIPFLLWMAWAGSQAAQGNRADGALSVATLGVFLGFYCLLIGVMGMWGRVLARRVAEDNLQGSLKRFNQMIFVARSLVPAWFGAGLFLLGWGDAVQWVMGSRLRALELHTPEALLATLPALLAWMGLWWSQYPADRALREQSLLIQLDENLPVHTPPGFGSYFTANLRLQVLFTIVPVVVILAAHDLVRLALRQWEVTRRWDTSLVETVVMLGVSAVVFVFAPELLRRVLHTQPLPDGPLRRRLEAFCQRHGLRYRDILLWRTQNNMGNAAVMGVLPQVRYILLSDLLLETMTDQQIEAVFAHEVGHIVHRHMIWYVVLILTLLFSVAGPGRLVGEHLRLPAALAENGINDLLLLGGAVAGFLLAFGFLSRRFERQADVFAARTVLAETGRSAKGAVSEYGAHLFASALQQVAAINNIPVGARSWCHGSIERRMRYVRHLSSDPAQARRFDRLMLRIYAGMLVVLVTCAGWALGSIRGGGVAEKAVAPISAGSAESSPGGR